MERGGTALLRAAGSDGERGVVGREVPSVDRVPVMEGPDTDPLRTLRRSESKKEKSRPFSRSSCIKQISVMRGEETGITPSTDLFILCFCDVIAIADYSRIICTVQLFSIHLAVVLHLFPTPLDKVCK